ncbi:MAG: hypothetical protein R2704_11790 [Microthrixaceae bacterium]
MPLSSGTTLGIRPYSSVALTRSLKVRPGSAVNVRSSGSIATRLHSADVSIAGPRNRESPGSGTT